MPIIDLPAIIDRIEDVDFLNPVRVAFRLVAAILSWLGIIDVDT